MSGISNVFVEFRLRWHSQIYEFTGGRRWSQIKCKKFYHFIFGRGLKLFQYTFFGGKK